MATRTSWIRWSLTLTALVPVVWSNSPRCQAQDVVKGGKKTIKIEWAHRETDNYDIAFEKIIPGPTVLKVGQELEDILEQYVTIFRFKPSPEDSKLQVKFLDSENTYLQEGGDLSHPAHYNGATKHLVLRQMPFYRLIPTVYHEAFHQYLDEYISEEGAGIPIWFNEGMATYFEGMQRNEKSKSKDLNPKLIDRRKMRMVQSAIRTRTAIPLADLIKAEHDQFHDKEKESLHYTQSFAVCYFLMQANKRLAFDFMKELQEKKDPTAAHAKIFGKELKNLKKFEARWKQYVLRLDLNSA